MTAEPETQQQPLTLQRAEAGLRELEALALAEYGVGLDQILASRDEVDRLRLVRLVGVQIKRPFAEPEARDGFSGNLGASQAWFWDPAKLNDPANQATAEFELLERVRTESGMEKGDLIGVSQEAGLMYIVGQWLYGKLTEDEAKSFIEVYHQKRSKETGLAISLANMLPVVGFFAGLTGVPAVGVSLAMLLVQYGFEKLTQPAAGPDA